MSKAPQDEPPSSLSQSEVKKQPPGTITEAIVKKEPPGTITEALMTPEKHLLFQQPNTPCGSEHSKSTPTKRKKKPKEASGHKTKLQKSPSKSYPPNSYISNFFEVPAIRSGTAEPCAQESYSKEGRDRVKKQLNFSDKAKPADNENMAEETKNERDGCSSSHDDIRCHGDEGEHIIIKDEEEAPQDYEPSRSIKDLIGAKIPDHIPEPAKVQVERNGLHKMVAFGVETTSLAGDCDIIQLTCSDLLPGREDFSTYIMPSKPIQDIASKVNGLTIVDGTLRQNGHIVRTVSLEEGVLQFIEHLQENTILISHNTKCFQSQHLIRNVLLEEKFLLERLRERVAGFSDSYEIYLDLFPRGGPTQLPSYKLWKLIKYFSKNFMNRAFQKPVHGIDNLMKIRNLGELLRFEGLTNEERLWTIYRFSMTFDSVVDVVEHRNMTKENQKTFADMVQTKYVSEQMAKKMASSGLTLQHLTLAYEYGGLDCLMELINPRITKNHRVIGNICCYCQRMT
ncbi:uncharacterized protein LOC135200594 [Macrobrachium nipponense]|uniref:uncharacterized protein LOC135200594 n=1 Tax=Macrobrachium nipponense TaxID=159736 RepID=UPI0030C808E7